MSKAAERFESERLKLQVLTLFNDLSEFRTDYDNSSELERRTKAVEGAKLASKAIKAAIDWKNHEVAKVYNSPGLLKGLRGNKKSWDTGDVLELCQNQWIFWSSECKKFGIDPFSL
jgi:hypothetical protein